MSSAVEKLALLQGVVNLAPVVCETVQFGVLLTLNGLAIRVVNMDELTSLQGKLESLKHLMEQYFMGIEKRLPAKQRDQVTREIRRFQPSNDAVARFKYQNLMQRLMTLERYWQRTIKAIEDGRYHRDVFKADFRTQNARRANHKSHLAATDDNSDDVAAAFMASLGSKETEDKVPKVGIRGDRKRAVTEAPKIPLRGKKRDGGDNDV